MGSGSDDPSAAALGAGNNTAESTAVSKQTTETLMAGERIMEAIELADAERNAFQEYETTKAKASSINAELQPPPRNPVLAAYDLEPDAYVLMVIEKVPGPALHDALLVLPFTKIISLMEYLNLWAQKVKLSFLFHLSLELIQGITGHEHHSSFTHYFFPSQNISPSSGC
jgi:U3 small nucleolar RNA-associated protein 12